ncbi:MAG: cytochrome c peroxidase [Steroidobacteraceae bacterium]
MATRVTPAFNWHLPRGFPVPAVPADNPMSRAKVALGRKLFHDPTLSVTGRYSCASCHDPARSFTDGRRLAIGATGETLRHNAMALVNVAYDIAFGWTEPAPRSLEAQMLEPMLNQHPVELGLNGRKREVVASLSRDAGYRREFAAAFSGEQPALRFRNVVKAIACFERTLISGDSPFDRYVFGDQLDALSPAAKRGMGLFFSKRLGCASCHSGFDFDGNWRDAQGETGPASFANDGTSREPIRVPTLRNLRYTAPYMHDGRYATLAAVIDHYVDVGDQPDSRHGGVRDPRLRRFTLSRRESKDLVAFLESLSDPSFVSRYSGRTSPRPRIPLPLPRSIRGP